MLGEGLQKLFIAEEFFEHLRRNFDEIAFSGEAREPCPLRLAAENGVHEMAELVEKRNDVRVLEQTRIVFIAGGKVADERSLGHRAAARSGDYGSGGEPLVLAMARQDVEIEGAGHGPVVEDFLDGDGRVPRRRG